MREPAELLGMYLHLAWASERRLRPHATDRLLVLAGALAVELQLPEISAKCRSRILNHNPQHLVKRWSTLKEAWESEDFMAILKQLRRRYPPEKVERMLHELEIVMGNERQAYYSDDEYATVLLDRVRRDVADLG